MAHLHSDFNLGSYPGNEKEMKVGDLITWTQRNERQIGIVVAFHSTDPDTFRFWKVYHNGETEVRREGWFKVLS